ncbi:hypothetical protein ALC62_11177, partial [Cyphomyrmex costatus]
LSYSRNMVCKASPDAKVKRKFTVTLPTEASRYFKGQRGNLIRVSDPDNYVGVIKERGEISLPRSAASRGDDDHGDDDDDGDGDDDDDDDSAKKSSQLEFMMADLLLFSSRRFRSS